MTEDFRQKLLLELLVDKCPNCGEYRPLRFIKNKTKVFMCFECSISWS